MARVVETGYPSAMGAVPSVLVASMAAAAALLFATWLVSLWLRDASIVDIVWGPGFAVVAWTSFAVGTGYGPRKGLVCALVTLWGVRLGAHILWRNAGKEEDFRYQAMRRRHGARFPWVSLYTVFGLQAALMWIVSLPVQLAQAAPEPARWTALDALGTALFAVGLGFEAVGDLQLARFKADPANAGRVLQSGLWRYTRHPNYFGDAVVWWGLGAIALATPLGVFALPGPAVMTFLLLRVSGVPMLERSLARSRPGYREYVERTSSFFPLPPRRRRD